MRNSASKGVAVLAAPPESKDSLGNLRHGLSGTCTVVGAAYKWNFHPVGQQGTPSDDRQGNGIKPLALPYDNLHDWDTRAKAAIKPLRVFVYPHWTGPIRHFSSASLGSVWVREAQSLGFRLLLWLERSRC